MENEYQERCPVITIIFVGINILVWVFMEIFGDTRDSYFMLMHGAAYYPLIVEDGEWWRLFTCMFLHFGAEHLINNMLILYLTGIRLEHVIGRFGFALLYLLSGLCGSILSLYMERMEALPAVSAGASGAVFGVIGGLVAMAIWNHGRIEGLSTKGLLGMLALSLYYGFSTAGVDNWGHIGGLTGGFILGFFFAVIRKVTGYCRK